MDIANYQKLAMRTSPEGHDRIRNGCLGLIGESGEIVDIVKKWKFQSGENVELPVDKLIDECGDVLWYCAELATGMNIDLARIYAIANEQFDCLREFHEESEIDLFAGRIATVAINPFLDFDRPEPTTEKWKLARIEQIEGHIVGIMAVVRDFLEIHCKVTMSGAMDYNIAKLRNRYPDGFDPERSLHREQEVSHE